MLDLYEKLGKVALGSRTRRLAEAMTLDAKQIYGLYGINLSPKWFPVFYVLSTGESKAVTAIAKEIGHSHVSVCKIVSEMKRAKLVSERGTASDKRCTLVTLSKAGRAIAEQIEVQYVDVNTALEQMSKEADHDLWEALKNWEQLLQRESLLDRVSKLKAKREMDQVRIVPYESKYRSAFKRLNEEWIRTYFKLEKPDREALGDPENYILNRGGHILVALIGEEPVGVCALMKREDSHYPWELAKMAVSPKAQGKKIGFLLGRAVIQKAQSLNADRLFLESNTILKPAIGLYEKLGFKKVEGPATPYQRCDIQMELNLRPTTRTDT